MEQPVADPTRDNRDLDLVLLQELGNSLRARSEAEHLYTAAAVGSFGALAWGVAALQPERYLTRPFGERPAGVAAIGVLIVAVFICIKICREHGVYKQTKKEQARIAKRLAAPEGETKIIPEYMLEESAGLGFLYSLLVVAVAAVSAAWFCWRV